MLVFLLDLFMAPLSQKLNAGFESESCLKQFQKMLCFSQNVYIEVYGILIGGSTPAGSKAKYCLFKNLPTEKA